MKFAIVNMVRTGMTQTNVAVHFSINRSTVSRILKSRRNNQNCTKKKGGPKFKLSEAAIRILHRVILKNNKKPLIVTVNEFRLNYGYNLSIKTIRRYVYKCGLRNYAAASKP